MKNICPEDLCTGCKACLNICPSQAIDIINNKYEIPEAKINEEKCTKCNLCIKVCPVNNPPPFNQPRKCYASWNKDESLQSECASGGVASTISDYIVNNNGYVCGAVFDRSNVLKHICTNDKQKIKLMRKSKYVQSDIQLSFREIKSLLNSNVDVAFIGTPCQVAGLKNFLKKDYYNLYSIDIICHGTPPITYFNEWIERIIPNVETPIEVSFRGKTDKSLKIIKDNKVIYNNNCHKDAYFYSFLNGLISRENCYKCSYTKEDRVSDMTLGDFWGINRETMINSFKGKISVVLTNTEKGEKLFQNISTNLTFEQREIKEAVDGNGQLRRPSIIHNKRSEFLNYYPKVGFVKSLKKIGIITEIKILSIKLSKPYQKLKTIIKRKKV